MKALFEVGEEVILVSKERPEVNGDSVVTQIFSKGDMATCQSCGSIRRKLTGGFSYALTTKHPDKCCTAWREAALRKKHKPSDFSFDEMMKEIKSIDSVKA